MPRRAPALSDAVVPLLVAAVISFGGLAHSGNARSLPMALGVAAGLSLFGRRRAPGLTLAVSGALVLVLLHIAPEAGATAVIAPAVALYSLALRRRIFARVLAGAAAVAAIVIAEVLQGDGPSVLQTLGHALLVAIPLLVADVHRVRHANLDLLQERLALAERTRDQAAERRAQDERVRIARDLHDVVAHTLTTINVQASTAGELLERRPEHAREALQVIEDASREAIHELRAILGVLRGGDNDTPLAPAPGLDDLPDLVGRARAEAVEVELSIYGERPSRIPEAVSLAAYRIAQESLTNARRHAEGAPVSVEVAFEHDHLDVTVLSGAPTSRNGSEHGAGVGILGMTERAATVGGTVDARPTTDGFRVHARLPCGTT